MAIIGIVVGVVALVVAAIIFGLMSLSRFSPKDFFLWLGAMVALYVSVGAFVTLLFNYIDILFPDKLDVTYYDPYSGPVRFAIASLIVVFPLFLFLTRLVHNEIRRDSEKASLGIRKWLVYLTIFAAGAFLTGDLIVLINTFLNGEITTRFLLKVAVVFALAGGIFWYYLEEIRGRWERDEKLSVRIGGAVGVLVVATVVSGFYLIGTPSDARALRFDQERVEDLRGIQWQVVEYWRAKSELPQELTALEDSLRFPDIPVDPDTGEMYGYAQTATTTFELCATFARESDDSDPRLDRWSYAYPIEPEAVLGSDWSHGRGEHCFERTIDPDYFTDAAQKPGIAPVPVR